MKLLAGLAGNRIGGPAEADATGDTALAPLTLGVHCYRP